MNTRKFIDRLIVWIEKLGLNRYRDEYDNWCYGNKKQKHMFHLHPSDTHADIEVNDSEKFNEFLEKFDIEPHSWHPSNWLIVDLVNQSNFEAAKEIIEWVAKS